MKRSCLGFLISVGLVACDGDGGGGGGGGGNTLSEADAKVALTATNSTVQGSGAEGASVVMPGIGPVFRAGTPIDEVSPCEGGGTSHLVGTQDEQGNLDGTLSASDCGSMGIVMSGSVKLIFNVSDTAIFIDYDGHMDYSGQIQGSCDMDLSISLPFDFEAPVEIEGTYCGYDAEKLLEEP